MRLHVEIEGSGPTVVLAHGFAGSARNFGPQARALRGRYRIVRYDARGHARSEAPDDPAAYGSDAMVADLGAVLDRAGADRAVVGGVSMGAMTALLFALSRPERVRGLLVAGLPASPRTGRGLGSFALRFADAIEREGLEAAGARFVWGPAGGDDAEDAKLVRQGFLEHRPHALVHLLRTVVAGRPDVAALGDRLAALRVPALVVAGERDTGAVEESRALVARLPAARLEIVAGAGHLVNLEAATRFNELVGAWLDALPPAA